MYRLETSLLSYKSSNVVEVGDARCERRHTSNFYMLKISQGMIIEEPIRWRKSKGRHYASMHVGNGDRPGHAADWQHHKEIQTLVPETSWFCSRFLAVKTYCRLSRIWVAYLTDYPKAVIISVFRSYLTKCRVVQQFRGGPQKIFVK